MLKDAFDKTCWILLFVTIAAISALLMLDVDNSKSSRAGLGKVAEREMKNRAKMELIAKMYGSVESLRTVGKRQEALLELDALIRKYPGEAHGHILQGQLLNEMGALDEAVSSYMNGLKLNGEYVDAKSPLSRRAEIKKLVEDGLQNNVRRALVSPDNRSLVASRQKLGYLQSRLAGGCE